MLEVKAKVKGEVSVEVSWMVGVGGRRKGWFMSLKVLTKMEV